MIRSELTARLAEANPHLWRCNCEAVVDVVLECIADALAAGGRVELRDFGTFAVKHQPARAGRNPRTGAVVDVRAKAAVQFRPGKAMKSRLNLEPEPVALAAE